MKKILVLCHYNTARSQMAEGYLKFFAGNVAMVHSAGIEQKNMHPMAFQIMDEDNIDIKEQRPKLAGEFLKNKYDFLITLCEDIPQHILKRIRTERHFHINVTDPLLRENDLEAAFRDTREIIKKFVLKFIGQELLEPVNP